MTAVDDLDARLDALAGRLDEALERVRDRPSPTPAEAPPDLGAAIELLREELQAAEASARLQAQRSQALEQQVADLRAALADANHQRDQAEAIAEAAREQTARVYAQLEDSLRNRGDASMEAKLGEALQAKLLEVERLSSELSSLRRSNEEWRTRARDYRRELEALTGKHDKAAAQLEALREKEAWASKRVVELERLVAEQTRELQLAERRAKHLREHMSAIPRSG